MLSKIPYKALKTELKFIYQTEIAEMMDGKRNNISRISYVDLLPAKTSFWSGDQTLQVIRKSAALNSLSGNNADAFVQQAATVLHQLRFRIGLKGMPAALEDQDLLWKSWMDTRGYLADSYTGDWVNQALSKIDKQLKPSDQLLNTVMKDMFLNDYFRNLYSRDFEEGQLVVEREINGLTPLTIPIKEKLQLKEGAENYEVLFSGRCTDSRIKNDLNNWLENSSRNLLPADIEITSSGFLLINKKTGWCSAFESNYAISSGSDFEKTVKLTLKTI